MIYLSKKYLILLILFVFSIFTIFASDINFKKSSTDFVTTWDTSKDGISNCNSITIPVLTGGTYYFSIDWNNDGVFEDEGLTSSITHDFGKPGVYTVRIKGLFPYFTFNNKGDKLKIISIDQWGSQEWKSMNGMFWGCENLKGNANDVPDLSNVIDMDGMFEKAEKFNQYIGDWDTSTIQNMAGMFSGATLFNQDLSNWNTSNVNDMSFMFNNAVSFDQNLSKWDTSDVTKMQAMFQLASSFNGRIGTWNTNKVTNMKLMFSQAFSFDAYIGNWNTANVKNMSLMFQGATRFSHDISEWNTNNVEYNYKMFYKAYAYNQ